MELLNHQLAGADPPPSHYARLDEPEYRREIIDQFHYLYYHAAAQTWMQTRWLGVPVYKCPLDLWIYQELIFAERPDVIVETGTFAGGSALFLATMCDVVGHGRVYTIDVNETTDRPEHPRIEYLVGSSTSDEIFAALRAGIKPGERVLVILDSDHSQSHVREELERFWAFIPPGGHLIVEDTNINAHPVSHAFGPGPMEAVDAFLAGHPEFAIDEACEKFFLTFNPRGYLRRTDGGPSPIAPKPLRTVTATPDPMAVLRATFQAELERLRTENDSLRDHVRASEQHIADRNAADVERTGYVRSLESDLERLQNGKLWKALQGIRKLTGRR